MTGLLRLGKDIFQHAVLIFGFACFGIVGIIYTLVSMTLYPLLPRRAGSWLGRNSIGWLFRIYLAMLATTGIIRLDLRELDRLRHEGGILVAPNHPSLLDAVLVISRLPSVSCIMKAQIWDSIFLGGGARLARYIRNDSPGEMVRLATEELRRGHQLLVFPEGTRTRIRPVNDFKGGFALIAKKSGAPIQTVFIETNSPFLGKGWPIWKKPAMPLVYSARLGRRFHVAGDVKAFVDELEQYFRAELGSRPPQQETRLVGVGDTGARRHAP